MENSRERTLNLESVNTLRARKVYIKASGKMLPMMLNKVLLL